LRATNLRGGVDTTAGAAIAGRCSTRRGNVALGLFLLDVTWCAAPDDNFGAIIAHVNSSRAREEHEIRGTMRHLVWVLRSLSSSQLAVSSRMVTCDLEYV
jgi:hypothetical protein